MTDTSKFVDAPNDEVLRELSEILARYPNARNDRAQLLALEADLDAHFCVRFGKKFFRDVVERVQADLERREAARRK
jgi:hypothetical protein